MSYPNIAVPNEFDYYYKTKTELYYLENYLNLLRNNNGKINSYNKQGLGVANNINSNNFGSLVNNFNIKPHDVISQPQTLIPPHQFIPIQSHSMTQPQFRSNMNSNPQFRGRKSSQSSEQSSQQSINSNFLLNKSSRPIFTTQSYSTSNPTFNKISNNENNYKSKVQKLDNNINSNGIRKNSYSMGNNTMNSMNNNNNNNRMNSMNNINNMNTTNNNINNVNNNVNNINMNNMNHMNNGNINMNNNMSRNINNSNSNFNVNNNMNGLNINNNNNHNMMNRSGK